MVITVYDTSYRLSPLSEHIASSLILNIVLLYSRSVLTTESQHTQRQMCMYLHLKLCDAIHDL